MRPGDVPDHIGRPAGQGGRGGDRRGRRLLRPSRCDPVGRGDELEEFRGAGGGRSPAIR